MFLVSNICYLNTLNQKFYTSLSATLDSVYIGKTTLRGLIFKWIKFRGFREYG